MFTGLALPYLLMIFIAGAIAVWKAGTSLSDQTDLLSKHFGWGEALGGVVLLAIATNLPEIAITVSAVLSNNVGVAIGNILGGIALQTVVLVILDFFMADRHRSLSSMGTSLMLAVEGLLVILVLALVVMATQLPASSTFLRLEPGSFGIAVAWIAGVWLIGKARKALHWHLDDEDSPDRQGPEQGSDGESGKNGQDPDSSATGIGRSLMMFVAASIVTLIGGFLLERSGDAIATHIGMSGVIFGSTVLAASTALPELSTGLSSVRMKDYQLAVSDIFGGNAFLPVLFLLAAIISGTAVLPDAQNSDIYLTSLGMVLTAIYVFGIIFRPRRIVARMGVDSLLVLIVYIIGLVGLFVIAS
ncbi:MAG: sodium:calcium antiporter [Thermomicrobiales bacterium]